MVSKKDIKQLIRELEKRKIPVDSSGKHFTAICPNGQPLVFPKTPSDSRSLRNIKAGLKRNGVDLTPTNKKAA